MPKTKTGIVRYTVPYNGYTKGSPVLNLGGPKRLKTKNGRLLIPNNARKGQWLND